MGHVLEGDSGLCSQLLGHPVVPGFLAPKLPPLCAAHHRAKSDGAKELQTSVTEPEETGSPFSPFVVGI